MRARRPLPDDPAIHRAALAYISDITIQESILRAHGVAWATPGLKVASLDHAMWWHRPGRVDDWMLYVQESPSARGGRGLATGRIYSRDGALRGQRRAGDHGARSERRRPTRLIVLSGGARRRSGRRGRAPRRRARRRERIGRPVAASTITTTAVARAYSSCRPPPRSRRAEDLVADLDARAADACRTTAAHRAGCAGTAPGRRYSISCRAMSVRTPRRCPESSTAVGGAVLADALGARRRARAPPRAA